MTQERYCFLDAQAEHAAHPDTFDAPEPQEIDAVGVGDYLKIGVLFDPNYSEGREGPLRDAFETKVGLEPNRVHGERFWLIIEEIVAEGFVGRINNILIYSAQHGLRCNDVLTVKRNHVLDVMWKEHGPAGGQKQ